MSAAPASTGAPLAPARRPGRYRHLFWAIPLGVILLLALPLLSDRTFGNDWPSHLWLVWQQSLSITRLGRPSYFLQASGADFEPFYAFYGGTFYSLTGALSVAIGQHPTVAYVAVIILALGASYAGWTWLAHQLGVRGWLAHLPGLIWVSAPYLITDYFGRGDVPEGVAVCSIPLVAASALAVLRAERLRVGTTVVFVLACTWLTAVHNITALWGTSFLIATGLIALLAIGPGVRSLRPRRLAATLGLGALGVAINAWYLFPAAAYGGRTLIAARESGISASAWDNLATIFDPLRSAPSEVVSVRNNEGWLNTPGTFDVQTPVLALGWALAVLAIAWRRIPGWLRRLSVGMLAIVLVVLALLLSDMSIVPRPWQLIQFPYRAQSYMTLGVCALVLGAILALPRIRARGVRVGASATLAVIAAVSLWQAHDQEWLQESSLPSRTFVYQAANHYPPSWYAEPDYSDASAKEIPFKSFVAIPGTTNPGGQGQAPYLVVPDWGHKDTSTITFRSPGPRPLATNALGGPYLVAVKGARVIGRTPIHTLAIEVSAPKGQQVKVTFTTAHTLPVVTGVLTTVIAILIGLALLARALVGSLRRRRLRPAPGQPGVLAGTPTGV